MAGICSGDTPSVPTLALKPVVRLETMGGAADHANDRTDDPVPAAPPGFHPTETLLFPAGNPSKPYNSAPHQSPSPQPTDFEFTTFF
jgi:hypothetical protein